MYNSIYLSMARYVIEAGPCAGKTTLCKRLQELGYSFVPEAARSIIEEERGKSDGILPWTNLYGFQMLVLARQLYNESRMPEAQFLDSGINRGLAYCKKGGIAPPPELAYYAEQRRYDCIYILDPLPYCKDTERVEEEIEAMVLHDLVPLGYSEYDKVRVPFFPGSFEESIDRRVEFILNDIQSKGDTNGRML
jgi:predicted ATPase